LHILDRCLPRPNLPPHVDPSPSLLPSLASPLSFKFVTTHTESGRTHLTLGDSRSSTLRSLLLVWTPFHHFANALLLTVLQVEPQQTRATSPSSEVVSAIRPKKLSSRSQCSKRPQSILIRETSLLGPVAIVFQMFATSNSMKWRCRRQFDQALT
jgi:hypothetical protein